MKLTTPVKARQIVQRLGGVALITSATAMWSPGSAEETPAIEIEAYRLEVTAYPETHRLAITATERLAGQADATTTLDFTLHQDFKIKHVRQGEGELHFTRTGSSIHIPAVRTGTNAPPLHWEYEGIFDPPPYRDDAMDEIFVETNEVRVTWSAPWYPALKHAIGKKQPASSLALEVPAGFVAVSGDEESATPQTASGRTRYEFTSSGHGSLSFCAAPYRVKRRAEGGRESRAYYFAKNPEALQKGLRCPKQLTQKEENVQEALEKASDILDFFTQTFCPYFSSSFSLVQKGAYKVYAYGVSTYVVMNDFEHYPDRFLAHEIAHQWWGSLIRPSGEGDRWLTESLAEYSAFLYLQHKGVETRVVNDRPDFLIAQMLNCTPLRKASFDRPDYENLVYHIGPYVFHTLRYVVGEEQFFTILRTFAREYAGKKSIVADFIQVAERVHKESLAWFFRDWLDHTRAPQFILECSLTNGGAGEAIIKGKVIQNRTEYRLPVRLEIVGAGQLADPVRTLWVAGKETPFEYSVQGQVQGIRFAEAMSRWVLGDFFNSAAEASQASVRKQPQPTFPANDAARSSLLVKSLKDQVKTTRAYQLGEEVTVTLIPKQAILLQCNENPFDLREILLCAQNDTLYQYAFWKHRGPSGAGLALSRQGHDFRTSHDVGFLKDWEIVGNHVALRFRVVTDAQEVERLLARKKGTQTQKK